MHTAVPCRGHETLARSCLCLREDYSWSLLSVRHGDQCWPFHGHKTSCLTLCHNEGLACKQDAVGLKVMPSHIRTRTQSELACVRTMTRVLSVICLCMLLNFCLLHALELLPPARRHECRISAALWRMASAKQRVSARRRECRISLTYGAGPQQGCVNAVCQPLCSAGPQQGGMNAAFQPPYGAWPLQAALRE